MKKNKFLALLLTCAMTVTVLAGCGSKNTTTAPSEDTNKPAESATYKIALIQQHQTNAFQIAVTEGAKAKAAELGVDLTILVPFDQAGAAEKKLIEGTNGRCRIEKLDEVYFGMDDGKIILL